MRFSLLIGLGVLCTLSVKAQANKIIGKWSTHDSDNDTDDTLEFKRDSTVFLTAFRKVNDTYNYRGENTLQYYFENDSTLIMHTEGGDLKATVVFIGDKKMMWTLKPNEKIRTEYLYRQQ
jgi:hypothetical protein